MTYVQEKDRLLNLSEYTEKLADSQYSKKIADALKKAQKHLHEKQFIIIVCGKAKQGKSALSNVTLNGTNTFFPVDMGTNAVSVISYGEEEKITAICGEIDKRKAKQISTAEIVNYVTEQGNHQNFQNTQRVMIKSPNPQLKGLTLIDTPGLSSSSTEHSALTCNFTKAGAVLFVSDASDSLSPQELDFISENIYPHCQNIIFVLTKIDAVDNHEKIVDINREKLARRLNVPNSEITIVPVSSKKKLHYLKSQDRKDLQDSNFELLESEIRQLMTQEDGQLLMRDNLIAYHDELSNVLKYVKEELSNCQKQNNQLKSRYQYIQQNKADWKKQLEYGWVDILETQKNEVNYAFVNLDAKREEYLKDDRLLDDPRIQIAIPLQNDVDMLVDNVVAKINRSAAALRHKIEEMAGVKLNGSKVKPLYYKNHIDSVPETVEVKKTGASDKAFAAGRGTLFGIAMGSLIDQAIEETIIAAIFPPAGLAFAAIGIVGTTIHNLSQLHEKERAALKAEVARITKYFITKSHSSCKEALDNYVKQSKRSMTEELSKQLEQEEKNYREGLERSNELKTTLKEIKELQIQARNLAESIAQQS